MTVKVVAYLLALLIATNLFADNQLRDPTLPFDINSDYNTSGYKITVIKKYGDDYSAVINKKTVAVGDVVDGAKVEAIKSNHAVIRINGKKQKLTLVNVKKGGAQ